MNRILGAFGALLVTAGMVIAADVPMRDGTVIVAESYRVTGSYVMVKMADGSQIAFDVADVDLTALRTAEAAAAAEAGEETAAKPVERNDSISTGRTLKNPRATDDGHTEGITITDRDVKHLRGSGESNEEEEKEPGVAAGGDTGEGTQGGGSVVLDNVRVGAIGEGRWLIQGEVVNRGPKPVKNVTVRLETQTAGAGGEPWRGEVQAAAALGPDERATFEHRFAAEVSEKQPQPSIRASVTWIQEETRRVPDYTKAGGVPHPSNLPFERGGVTGADVRPTPVQ